MLDIKWIREKPELFDEALAKRDLASMSSDIIALDSKRRQLINELQQKQEERNNISKHVADAAKVNETQKVEILKQKVSLIKEQIKDLEKDLDCVVANLQKKLDSIPNIPLASVPYGKDENDNVEVHRYGEPANFSFEPKQHFDLGENLGLMDFEKAAKISGARFTILRGDLARLERALAQFMLDLHTKEHGYTEMSVPLLVRDEAMYGTGQLPKFKEDLFQTTDGRWLISTNEVSLTNYVREEILDPSLLPMRLTALSPCFRSEAGAAGRDTRGMLRQHQFWKVEMVSIVHPEEGEAELEKMRGNAQEVLELLGLPYRTVVLCSGDMGFSAKKTYDIEVWMPGQNTYREISSCSLCGDFQARRMNARYRDKDGKIAFVSTLNGSGVAVGRCLIAVMENYQQEDGSIIIPDVLQPYMNNKKIITKI